MAHRALTLLVSTFLAGCAVTQRPTVSEVAAPEAAKPADSAAVTVHGRLEDLGNELTLLRTWGTPAQRGYAHGYLLGREVANVGIQEFEARFSRGPGKAILELARKSVDRLIEYPEDIAAEIDGVFRGVVASGAPRHMKALGRDFDLVDLKVANALDVFGLMGCSGITVWGERAAGGGVLTARNFDWPLTGPHLLDGTIVLVQHLTDGTATASITWPGYVPVVTGISSEGVAAFLHVGSGKVTLTPEPDSWPTGVAARRILESVRAAHTPKDAFAKAEDLLSYTSPPAGFLTRVVLPSVPAKGAPVAVFETDSKKPVRGGSVEEFSVVTNHFFQRRDGRGSSRDSERRVEQMSECVAGCFDGGDQKVSPAEAWEALTKVERGGGRRFGTLHSLVFRQAPWCFELRIGTQDERGRIVPATQSARRFALKRDQLFPARAPGPDPVPVSGSGTGASSGSDAPGARTSGAGR
ncbi:MAG: C45 family peptidase [bacterium]|nr:C45 family peptidase [bacterium]